jgi:hypothetical protein
MNEQQQEQVGLWAVVASVMGAMFGVRGSKAHQRDFTKGRPAAYVIVGLIFTAIFVLTIVTVVMLVMHFTGS